MKIYDCFTYFNEIEMAQFRIEYLKDAVDYFVITEATETHTGNFKEMSFPINSFDEEVRKKIIYLPFSFPKDIINYLKFKGDYMLQTNHGLESWSRENYQRDYLYNGIVDANDDDVILITDLDEIPNQKTCDFLKTNSNLFKEYPIISLACKFYRFNIFNNSPSGVADPKGFWYHPKATTKKYANSPDSLRLAPPNLILENAGWHFSSFCSLEEYKNKAYNLAPHSGDTSPEERFEYGKKWRNADLKKIKEKEFVLENNLPDLVFSDKYKKLFTYGMEE